MGHIPKKFTPIIKMLSNHLKTESVVFHMPGHNRGKAFTGWFRKHALSLDTTELDSTDDLNNPKGVFQEASSMAALAFGSKETFLITCGATIAVHAAVLGVVGTRKKVLVFRNVHASVMNACILFELIPVFAEPANLGRLLEEHPDAKALIVTHPDYYGECIDIKLISELAGKYKCKLIVDEAHGTHFNFCPSLLPTSAIKLGADIVVHSAHKTTPALTQSAFLHISEKAILNDISIKNRIQEAILILSTTSPSFLIAASCDYSRAFMEKSGDSFSITLNAHIDWFCKMLSPKWQDCLIVSSKPFKGSTAANTIIYPSVAHDPFRIVFDLSKLTDIFFSPAILVQELKDHGILVEFHDILRIVLICNFYNSKADFRKLALVMNRFLSRQMKFLNFKSPSNLERTCSTIAQEKRNALISLDKRYLESFFSLPCQRLYPSVAIASRESSSRVTLESAFKRIAAAAVTPYPPGVPLIWPGEVFSEEIVSLIRELHEIGMSINGIEFCDIPYSDDPMQIRHEIFVRCFDNPVL